MLLLALLVNLNPLSLFPDSVDVLIRNDITEASIISVHYFIRGSGRMAEAELSESIPPGGEATVTLPYRYMNRLVFRTTHKGSYRRTALALNPMGDTLSISRADKEFGDFFDVIMGERPFLVRNSTPVPITAVNLHAQGLPTPSIIGPNPLMTGERLFLWLDRDSIAMTAVDIEGNLSDTLRLIYGDADITHAIPVIAFLREETHPPPGANWLINGINGERIIGVEIYPVNDEPFYVDLSQAPLGLWDWATIPYSGPIDYMVCVDEQDREYTVDERHEETGAYIADWWHLDFDFSFPERRR